MGGTLSTGLQAIKKHVQEAQPMWLVDSKAVRLAREALDERRLERHEIAVQQLRDRLHGLNLAGMSLDVARPRGIPEWCVHEANTAAGQHASSSVQTPPGTVVRPSPMTGQQESTA